VKFIEPPAFESDVKAGKLPPQPSGCRRPLVVKLPPARSPGSTAAASTC
jgi:hypothetical protein